MALVDLCLRDFLEISELTSHGKPSVQTVQRLSGKLTHPDRGGAIDKNVDPGSGPWRPASKAGATIPLLRGPART
jgi:hypothetical protein